LTALKKTDKTSILYFNINNGGTL